MTGLLPPSVTELVDFYREHPTAKSDRIRARFGISMPRYWQLLVKAMATPEALKADAHTVRLFEQRMAAADEKRRRRREDAP